MNANPTVFVVDDDPAMRESLRWLIESVGLSVETYANAQEFLDRYDPTRAGCLVLDVRMPGMSGLDLQEKLSLENVILPVIIITGHADLPMAIRALKAGAVDFIEKPFSDQVLLDRIRQSLEIDSEMRNRQAHKAEIASREATLTEREREVMNMVVEGKPNKVMADLLGLSQKTVEVHRSNVMKKMQAESLPELVRFALTLSSE